MLRRHDAVIDADSVPVVLIAHWLAARMPNLFSGGIRAPDDTDESQQDAA